jgi:hypothetical protein
MYIGYFFILQSRFHWIQIGNEKSGERYRLKEVSGTKYELELCNIMLIMSMDKKSYQSGNQNP